MNIDRIPPQNIEAEQAVIGAMLLDREAIPKVVEVLRPDDYYRESHRLIYNAMLELSNKNDAVDMVTIIEFLRRLERLEAAGGISYITSLANSVPTASNVLYHARIVEEKALLRRLITVGTNIVTDGYEVNDEDVLTKIDIAEKNIMAVKRSNSSREFTPIKTLVLNEFNKIEQLHANKGQVTGIPSGFGDLDRLTAGFQPSDLILIAARPSMGKTALVLNIATHVAIQEKKTVAFFSLEMSKEQLTQRMLASEAIIDSSLMRIGALESSDWTKLVNGADRVASAKIFIDDTPGMTVMEMRSKARKLKSQKDLKLIIIDYLQLMGGAKTKANSENRQQEVSDISRSLKALARELDVPIIALSQLSRSVESRQVKKPMLSDLRESGSLEQDADIVAFLYRDDYYNPDSEQKNITELNIAKHRNGPVDTINLFFHKKFTKFSDLSRKE